MRIPRLECVGFGVGLRPHGRGRYEGRSLRYDFREEIGRVESGTETENETGVQVESNAGAISELAPYTGQAPLIYEEFRDLGY